MNDDHDLVIMLLLLAALAFIVWLDHVEGPLLVTATVASEVERCS